MQGMTRAHKLSNLFGAIVPFLAFSAAIVLLWNQCGRLERPGDPGVMYLAVRLRRDRRLSTACSRTARSRPTSRPSTCSRSLGVDGGPGPVIDVGRRPPQAPRAHRRGGRPALPARRPRRRIPGRAPRPLARAHRLAVRHARPAPSGKQYARDLVEDRGMRFINRQFPLASCCSGSRSRPALGFLLTGTLKGALTGLFWGGFVRIFMLHHVTWSINSVCHFFGRRRFDVEDHSTNVFWLALPSLRRVLAPQPPRVPALGGARPEVVGGRRVRRADPRDAADRAGVERGPDLA